MIVGFDGWEDRVVPKQDVIAIYYHEGESYSVAIEKDNQISMFRLPTGSHTGIPLAIITDIKPDGTMWIECEYSWNHWHGEVIGKGCEIHIRDIDDIGTAGWNHGKNGSGQTTRIN